jgi:hypothetical protein
MTNVLFRLREYDDAFRDLFGRVMRAHAEEACAASTTFAGREVIVAAPGLSASKEDPDRASTGYHTSQVTLPSGEPLKNEPFDMKVPFRFNLSDMINGDVDAFTTSVEASGVGRQYPVRAKTIDVRGAARHSTGDARRLQDGRYGPGSPGDKDRPPARDSCPASPARRPRAFASAHSPI